MIRLAPSAEDLNDLVDQLRATLAADGTVIADVSSLTVSPEVWRRAARRAGKVLGRPTRTVAHGGVVQAYLTDWPAAPHEQRILDQRRRAAVEHTFLPADR